MSLPSNLSSSSQNSKTAIRRRSSLPKRVGPSSASSPAPSLNSSSSPSSFKPSSSESVLSEDYLINAMIPVSKQPTHRKNDYATILALLKNIDPNSSLIKSVEEAESIERSIGSWFLVRGCERSVVKLGIGANPGLKKYYWRANCSKRLLKREMEDGSEEASLVYIIQKASPVSKRCASIPDTDIWLVMYLPATLRAAADVNSRKVIGPSRRFPGPSSPSTASLSSPPRKRSRNSDDDESDFSSDSYSPSHSESLPSISQAPPSPVKVVRAASSPELAPPASPKRQRSPKRVGPSHLSHSASPGLSLADLNDMSAPHPYQLSDDCVRSCDSELPLFLDCQFADPEMSIFASPDPFLPLAGSQTIFSAAIEAACMSGLHAPWMSSQTTFDLSEFVF